jgi:hypothetical protein
MDIWAHHSQLAPCTSNPAVQWTSIHSQALLQPHISGVESGAPPVNSPVNICRHHVWCRAATFQFRCGHNMSKWCPMWWKAVHHLSIQLSTYVDIMSDVLKSGASPFNSAVDICRHHIWCRGATFQFRCGQMSTSCRVSWKAVHHLSMQLSTYVDIMSDVVKSGAPPFNSAVDKCRHHVRCREKRCTTFQFSCRQMSTSCPMSWKVVHHLSIQVCTYVDIMSDVLKSGAPPFNSAVDICRHHVRCREQWCTTFQFSCRHMSTSCPMSWKVVHHLSIQLSTYVDIMSDVVKSGAPPFNSAVDICRHHVRCREQWCTTFQFRCGHMSTSCLSWKVVHHLSIQLSTYVDIMSDVVKLREKWCTTFQFSCRHMLTSCLMSWKVVHHLSIQLSTYVDICPMSWSRARIGALCRHRTYV